jgi:exosome complex component RRP4
MKSSKRIVVPGTTVDKNVRYNRIGEYFVRDYRGLVATLLGVVQQGRGGIDLIPYKDVYRPSRGDYVIGVVVGYAPNGWILDIGSYTKAFLPASEMISNRRFDPRRDELSKYLAVGDVVGVKISDVRRLGYFGATLRQSPEDKDKRLGRIRGYYIMKVTTTKLPRIIGKKGSMIRLIKQKIKGDIVIAQNGVILFKGPYEEYLLLKKIINLIAAKTFASGLTDTVAGILGISSPREAVAKEPSKEVKEEKSENEDKEVNSDE